MLEPAMNRLHYQTMLDELRRMNGSQVMPKLSYNSLLYLDIIDMTPDCTVSRLADLLHVSRPAVTAKVKELFDAGLIEKRRSPDDGRVHYLAIKPDIEREYRGYDKSMRRAVDAVEAAFGKKEIALFCRMLEVYGDAYAGRGSGNG